MADSAGLIDNIQTNQSQKEVTANAAFDALSASGLYGRRATTSALLTWGYYGGRWNGTAVATGTLTLTASTTNYIVALRTTGAVSVSTSITNWNNQSAYLRLYLVVTSATTATSWEDHRQAIAATPLSGVEINAQTGTTYTLVAADNDKVVDLSNAAAITLTLPATAAVGFRCSVIQSGAGQVTLSPAGSATLRNRQSHTKTAGQWAEIKLTVRTNAGGSAAEYVMSGDTAA